jgi:crossover junction endodeoxyribonuclease RuvC
VITIGIDPGLSGAIAVLVDGQFEAVHDMPVVTKGTGRKEVNPADLQRIIRGGTDAYNDTDVAIEKVSASPQMGVSSAFSFGDSFGCVRSVTACCNLGTVLVSPAVWKRHFKLGKDKELSRALAVRMFPTAQLNLKKHADRAEALLIAVWLWETGYK